MVARLLVLIATLAGCDEVFRFNRADESTPRSVLRLAGFSPAETLTDFPLLVVLDDTRAARELMLPGAADLRFLDVDGNVLPHQIEQVGTPGGAPLIAWVRVPEVVGASTAIAVSYGRTEVPAAATAPVWSASYVAVWHLADTLADATGNNHEGVALGATSAAGIIGGARQFDAASENAIQIPSSAGFDVPAITVSGWMFQRSPRASGFQGLLTHEIGTLGTNDLYLGTNKDSVFAEISVSTHTTLGAAAPEPGTWFHLALVAGASGGFRLYIDGELAASQSTSGTVMRSPGPMYLGGDCNGCTQAPDSDFVDGLIDEVRFEQTARTSAWIAADYASMTDQAITYGAVDRAP